MLQCWRKKCTTEYWMMTVLSNTNLKKFNRLCNFWLHWQIQTHEDQSAFFCSSKVSLQTEKPKTWKTFEAASTTTKLCRFKTIEATGSHIDKIVSFEALILSPSFEWKWKQNFQLTGNSLTPNQVVVPAWALSQTLIIGSYSPWSSWQILDRHRQHDWHVQ